MFVPFSGGIGDVLWEREPTEKMSSPFTIECDWSKYDYIAILYVRGISSLMTSDKGNLQATKVCDLTTGIRTFRLGNLSGSSITSSINSNYYSYDKKVDFEEGKITITAMDTDYRYTIPVRIVGLNDASSLCY